MTGRWWSGAASRAETWGWMEWALAGGIVILAVVLIASPVKPRETMIFMCIGCHSYPENQIDHFSGYERRHPELSRAWEKLFEGEFSRVEEIIAQPLEENDSEAIFISAAFSRREKAKKIFTGEMSGASKSPRTLVFPSPFMPWAIFMIRVSM